MSETKDLQRARSCVDS